MSDWREHPVFLAAIALLSVALIAEVFLYASESRRLARAQSVLKQRRAALRSFESLEPAPTPVSSERIQSELNSVSGEIAELEKSISLSHENPAGGSSEPIDVFFEINAAIERLRAAAREREIELAPKERFGFSAYIDHGPLPPDANRTETDVRAVESLLRRLFAAQPRRLVSVHRTISGGTADVKGKRTEGFAVSPSSRRADDDGFALRPDITAAATGLVRTSAVKLIFEGQTEALRCFLNSIVSVDQAWFVRLVEVEPVHAKSQEAEPFVAPTVSRFTVVVERVTLPEKT